VLWKKTDRCSPGRVRLRPTQHSDAPCIGYDQAKDCLERRCLARPIGAEQAEDLACFHVKGKVLERGPRPPSQVTKAVCLGQVL